MLFFTALSVAKCHNRLPFAAKADTPQLFRSPLSSTPTATHFVPDLGEEMPMKPPVGAAHFSRSGVFSAWSAIYEGRFRLPGLAVGRADFRRQILRAAGAGRQLQLSHPAPGAGALERHAPARRPALDTGHLATRVVGIHHHRKLALPPRRKVPLGDTTTA